LTHPREILPQPNHLEGQSSPYLLQHLYNPVDWYPWGDDAIEKARTENKPIFLSIGYSACHWCHVMERESFENASIALLLNEDFVSIKVDREELPDVDDVYMTFVQAYTGSGGWPLTAFLTPDLKPFFGGTYFPPDDNQGRPGFAHILTRIADLWRDEQAQVIANAQHIVEQLRDNTAPIIPDDTTLDKDLVDDAARDLLNSFDRKWGGFGDAPKFPSGASIQILLRQFHRTGEQPLLDAASHTLDRMAYGGIYDQLGGGFARYSVDDQWLVPHFEKMLYDNALLVPAYLDAWQLTGNPEYARIVRETLDYVMRDMTDESGGFCAAEDADSEGVEGKFYVWDKQEIESLLDADSAGLIKAFYGTSDYGNFEGHNILHVPVPPATFAAEHNYDLDALWSQLEAPRQALLARREQRIHPGKDQKVLASWNGLMIAAFARAAQVLDDSRYRDAAVRAAGFIRDEMLDGTALLHVYCGGAQKIPGYVDDYAAVAIAMTDVYEATSDASWLHLAGELIDAMLARFHDNATNTFFLTTSAHSNLYMRPQPTYDGAVPSGNSLATMAMLRLSYYLDRADWRTLAIDALGAGSDMMKQAPRGFMNQLLTVDYHLHPPAEIAILGCGAEADAMRRVVNSTFVPNRILVAADSAIDLPLLQGKEMIDGKPTAFVCRNYACQLPVTTPDALAEQLRSLL
jgi:uncharacterized protein YyaL (SSP411 family)